MRLLLKLINGEEIKQVVDADECVIGRSSKSDVVVPHEGMSRSHCKIELINGEFYVTDLGSTNGVLLDGEKIPANEKVKYQTFFILSFGPVQSLTIIPDEGTNTRIQRKANESANALPKVAPLPQSPVKAKPKFTQEEKPQPTAEKKIQIQEKPKQKTNPVYIYVTIVVMILCAAGWWYVNNDTPEITAPVIIN